MCQPLEFWSFSLAVVCAVLFVTQGFFQHAFFASLERSSPLLWKALTSKPNKMDSTDLSGTAGAQWFLLKGDFSELVDVALVTKGKRARMAVIAFIAVLGAWGLFVWVTQAPPRLTCIPGLGV